MLQRTSRDIPALLITILIISVAWLITFRGGHDWGGDFSLYIAHARNIAEGRNYNAVNFVTVHDSPLQSPPAYPPVFPLLLAPVYAMYGLDYSAMKVCVQALWFVFVVLFYIYERRMGLSPWLAASVLIVLMLSYVLLDLKDSVLSESTYMVVSTATLLLTDLVYTRRLDESHPVRYGALLGMMLALTILTRITGIGLVGAFGVYELYRFRRIRLFAIVAGIVFAVFFVFYQLTLAGGGGYANHLAWKSQALVDNVVFYFKSPALLWGQLTVPFRYSLAVAFLVISGLGYVRRFLKHAGLSEFYVGLYMIPLLLFHNGATPRYCVPVYAFLLVYAAEELRFWITTYFPRSAESLHGQVLASLYLQQAPGMSKSEEEHRSRMVRSRAIFKLSSAGSNRTPGRVTASYSIIPASSRYIQTGRLQPVSTQPMSLRFATISRSPRKLDYYV